MDEDTLIARIELWGAPNRSVSLLGLLGRGIIADLALGRHLTHALARGRWPSVRLVPSRAESGASTLVVDLVGSQADAPPIGGRARRAGPGAPAAG